MGDVLILYIFIHFFVSRRPDDYFSKQVAIVPAPWLSNLDDRWFPPAGEEEGISGSIRVSRFLTVSVANGQPGACIKYLGTSIHIRGIWI